MNLVKLEELIDLDVIYDLAYDFKPAEIEKYKKPEQVEAESKDFDGGIYRFYDKNLQIIYVGKSSNLHRRWLQHFGKRTNTADFIDEVESVDFLVENNPIYRTLLESIFIAYHEPKYNDEVQDERKIENEK
jgi:GIY-YIG catalytic domain